MSLAAEILKVWGTTDPQFLDEVAYRSIRDVRNHVCDDYNNTREYAERKIIERQVKELNELLSSIEILHPMWSTAYFAKAPIDDM